MSDEAMRSPAAATPSAYDPTLVGIRGWLVLPAIGLVVALVSALLGLAGVFSLAEQGAAVLGVGLLIQVPIVLFIGYVAQAFFAKRRNAPRLCIILQWVTVTLLGLLWMSGLDPDPRLPGQVVSSAVAAFVWTMYFQRSQRVRQTFIH